MLFVYVLYSRLFIATLWSHAGKGLTSWLLFVMLIVFPMWYSWSGVILDFINSDLCRLFNLNITMTLPVFWRTAMRFFVSPTR